MVDGIIFFTIIGGMLLLMLLHTKGVGKSGRTGGLACSLGASRIFLGT